MANPTFSSKIELRLVGEGIEPGHVRSRELAEIIESVEDMVIGVLLKEDPTLDRDTIVVGLSSIAEGSLRLGFSSPQQQRVIPAFSLIAAAVASHRLTTLPNQSLRSLGRVSGFAKRHSASAQFFAVGEAAPLAILGPEAEVPPPQLVSGETTVFGRIIRVGGRRPRVMVESLAGETVYCDASSEVTKELASMLYDTAELEGRALWDPDDWSLQEFRIERVSGGPRRPKPKTLAELSSLVGQYYRHVQDPVSYVAALRSGGEA